MSAATASVYVEKLVRLEAVASGTNEAAFEKLARDYDMTVSQLVHLYKRRAKKCDVSLFARVKRAYYDRCARMVAALQLELAFEEALSGNADDQDLVDRLTAIAAEVAAQRTALHAGKEMK